MLRSSPSAAELALRGRDFRLKARAAAIQVALLSLQRLRRARGGRVGLLLHLSLAAQELRIRARQARMRA